MLYFHWSWLFEHQLLSLTTLSLWPYQLLILHQCLLLVIPSLLLVSNFYNGDLRLSLVALAVVRCPLVSATAGLANDALIIPADLLEFMPNFTIGVMNGVVSILPLIILDELVDIFIPMLLVVYNLLVLVLVLRYFAVVLVGGGGLLC